METNVVRTGGKYNKRKARDKTNTSLLQKGSVTLCESSVLTMFVMSMPLLALILTQNLATVNNITPL